MKIIPVMGVSCHLRNSGGGSVQSLVPPIFQHGLKLLLFYQEEKKSSTFLLHMAMFITIISVDHVNVQDHVQEALPLEVVGYSGRWIWGTSATGQWVTCGDCSCMQSTDEKPLVCFYAHFIALVLKIYVSNVLG